MSGGIWPRLCVALSVLVLCGALPIAAQSDLTVLVSGQSIEQGETFYTPTGNEGSGNKVALFSKSDASYTIRNEGDDPVVVSGIELDRGESTRGEEFQLLNTDLEPKPLEIDQRRIEPGEELGFKLRFYPVRSGARRTTVTVVSENRANYSWQVVGTGRNEAQFFSRGRVGYERLLGTAAADELATAMVADSEGNMFVSGQGSMVIDSFNNDVYFARVNADGSLGWSRIWSSEEDDRSIDPGQNAETGGSSEAMARDTEGNIYFAGTWDNAAMVVKLDPESGQPMWERYWMAGWPSYEGGRHTASDFADAYSVDVQGDNVYVTGTTQNAVLLLALDRADGTVVWQRKLDLYDGYADRGYAVRADGNGNIYVAGSGNNDGYLAKLRFQNGSDTAPAFQWARRIKLGTGGNVNSFDIGPEGNLYLSCDRRGAQTALSLIAVDPAGEQLWGKTWEASATDSNNSHVVRVLGDHVYFGGRIGVPTFDTQFGDGALLKLNRADGSAAWRTFYYTGKGPEEMTEHRIKGIARADGALHVFSQAYSSSYNRSRFWGYWYDGIGALSDFEPTIQPIEVNPSEHYVAVEEGESRDLSDNRRYLDGSDHLQLRNARKPYDGETSNGELMFSRLEMRDE